MKHNRQYSTISKRYSDENNIRDLISQRILSDRSNNADVQQQDSLDSLTYKINLDAQKSPDTTYRLPKNDETAKFD